MADGEGSERRSPRDRSGSGWVWGVGFELVGMEGVVDFIDGFDEDEELDDRTIIPATGMQTIQRRRLSKPWRPRSRWILSLAGLRLMVGSERYVLSLSLRTAFLVRIPMFTMSRSRILISR